MTLVDLLTFIVSFGLFIFLMFRQALRDRDRRLHPDVVAQEEAEAEEEHRRFLRELDIDEEEEEELPQEIRPRIQAKPVPQPPIQVEIKKTIRPEKDLKDTYAIHNANRPSRAQAALARLPDPKSLMIYHEIFGPPKAYRDD
jgi:hypothetical protein